jgi:hypothetical protein
MRTATIVAALAAAAGSPLALADRQPQTAPHGTRSDARVVGHIYFNAATGERVGLRVGDGLRGFGSSDEIWMNDNDLPCADIDPALYTQAPVAIVDDPSYTGGIGLLFLDWADVPPDTVIDCVQLATFADHQDTDADGDGIADGVHGLASTWSWYEADNGFNACFRQALISITLLDLPGNTDPGAGVEGYVYTIDLADFLGDGSTDLSFEIGDSDGDPQSAAVHNPFIWLEDIDSDGEPDGDIDADGRMDFSYAQQYHQPGTRDFDGDGQPDGDPDTLARTYMRISAPRGSVAPTPPTTFTIDDSFPGGSVGQEDAFDIFSEDALGFWQFAGTFWWGGFTCDRDGDGVFEGDDNGSTNGPDDYRPHGSFFIGMFGPGGDAGPCPADLFPPLAPDGVINFFDYDYFFDYFAAGDSRADLYPFGRPDGQINFFDIYAFMDYAINGCP